MQQKDFELALQEMRQQSKPRKFVQSVEMILNFKELDVKKPDSQIDVKLTLPYSTGKKGTGKTLLFAKDKRFMDDMKGKVDRIVDEAEISKLAKKDIDVIANDFDVTVAEGPVMLVVAKFLGQQLAPKGKMPKPIQPDADATVAMLKQLGGFMRVTNKKGKVMPTIQLLIGSEQMKNSEISANAIAIADAVLKQLPRKEQNMKSVYIKLTMGPPVKVGAKEKAAGGKK